MSWIQAQEELAYDTQSEYIAVLRADHFDPYEFVVECEEHREAFDLRFESCTKCPVVEPEPFVSLFEGEEPPF